MNRILIFVYLTTLFAHGQIAAYDLQNMQTHSISKSVNKMFDKLNNKTLWTHNNLNHRYEKKCDYDKNRYKKKRSYCVGNGCRYIKVNARKEMGNLHFRNKSNRIFLKNTGYKAIKVAYRIRYRAGGCSEKYVGVLEGFEQYNSFLPIGGIDFCFPIKAYALN